MALGARGDCGVDGIEKVRYKIHSFQFTATVACFQRGEQKKM